MLLSLVLQPNPLKPLNLLTFTKRSPRFSSFPRIQAFASQDQHLSSSPLTFPLPNAISFSLCPSISSPHLTRFSSTTPEQICLPSPRSFPSSPHPISVVYSISHNIAIFNWPHIHCRLLHTADLPSSGSPHMAAPTDPASFSTAPLSADPSTALTCRHHKSAHLLPPVAKPAPQQLLHTHSCTCSSGLHYFFLSR